MLRRSRRCCSHLPVTAPGWLLLLQVIRNPLDVVLSAYQYHTQVGATSGLGTLLPVLRPY